ncbi:MAG: 4-hydroxybutyrate CoA-transferase, partial [Pseudomonadales bacterium]|nr:4-hydroxybutyrate CoA-transferase [Pseudomonadales bacterium]
MDVQALYQEKLMTIEEAVGYVENGSNVILGMSVAMPPGLITGLSRRIESGDLDKIYLYYMHGSQTLQNTLLQEALQAVVCPRPMFMSAFDRHAIPQDHQGWMQFVPATFHQVGRLLTEHIDPECFMVTVSPMDQHGYFSLGTNADYGATVIRKAKRIMVEVNHHMPRTFGECSVHISEIDHIVEHDKPLMSASPAMPSEVDLAIARQISEMIKDGDTLQMGVGGVPNAVLGELTQHQDLGLHTELFSPAMVDLIKSGVINGHRKSV